VPWGGNAKDWYYNAQKFGRKVGKEPRKGAILVTRESWYGHVSFIESVDGNKFTVSEMNNPFWGKVTRRTLTVKSVPVVGFIY
jgi:surface antigen